MLPKINRNITDYFGDKPYLNIRKLSDKVSKRNRIFCKGQVKIYDNHRMRKFVTLSVKGYNVYQYDFGIAYPLRTKAYPMFIYQIITTPRRVLVLTHYATNIKDVFNTNPGLIKLLETDKKHADILLKPFEPQEFLKKDIVKNDFNGLVRTYDINNAHEKIVDLFEIWYRGLDNLEKDPSMSIVSDYTMWADQFRNSFYYQDYGFNVVSRYLGIKWTKDVFEKYVFEILNPVK
ncbi:MAG: hypothetical protein ACLKAK_05255 [Alkaliphilus sp.]